ncbi:unnamed protein product [Cyclocybe aegerita]|uniref:SnoaL-like domain-containing protein n=1 Tax=Cyclocybe aegerita TaxID=1973307 RepID=A0A8S0VS82_CYCAE|nr:unnamed protein product [Cyclocybe aegerita]
MSHQEDNVRSVIKQWIDSIARRDWAALSSLATPDAMYWIAGLKSKIPYAGTELYSERVKLIRSIFGPMSFWHPEIVDITVEGDTGVLETKANGEGPKEGQIYSNAGIFKFVVRDGKIIEVKEFLDFFAVYAYMGIEVDVKWPSEG